MSATIRQQSRKRTAKQLGAHTCDTTALHGYARFASHQTALQFAATLADAVVSVYDQSSQYAVDWTDRPRYANNNVVR